VESALLARLAYRLQLIVIKCIPFGMQHVAHSCWMKTKMGKRARGARQINRRDQFRDSRAADFDLRHFCDQYPPSIPSNAPSSIPVSPASSIWPVIAAGSAFLAVLNSLFVQLPTHSRYTRILPTV